jgi:hypothetical protein
MPGWAWILCAAVVAVSLLTYLPAEDDELWQNFDDEDLSMWSVIGGTWVAQDRAYVQTDNIGPHYRHSLVDFPMGDGIVEVDATVLAYNEWARPFGSFGLLWKWVDVSHHGKLRFGAYNQSNVSINGPSGSDELQLGSFHPVVGQTYHLKVEILNGTVTVSIDGVVRCVVYDLQPGVSGKPGLYTESHTSFDNFHAVRY